MEDHVQDANCSDNSRERNEPVRTRWSPKPDQILILESIFNSGMVNPPKDETVRIRKLLEKFGPVGDANVFYWFQNRRSRSRRRQRQIQASPAGEQHGQTTTRGGATHEYESGSASGIVPSQNMGPSQSSDCLVGASSPCGNDVNDLFSVSGQLGFPVLIDRNSSTASALSHSDTSSFQNQSGGMMVFINGVPTEVGRGPIDIKGMFGEDVLLVHSSGMPIFFNDYGFSVQTLQHGESYFLVPRPS